MRRSFPFLLSLVFLATGSPLRAEGPDDFGVVDEFGRVSAGVHRMGAPTFSCRLGPEPAPAWRPKAQPSVKAKYPFCRTLQEGEDDSHVTPLFEETQTPLNLEISADFSSISALPQFKKGNLRGLPEMEQEAARKGYRFPATLTFNWKGALQVLKVSVEPRGNSRQGTHNKPLRILLTAEQRKKGPFAGAKERELKLVTDAKGGGAASQAGSLLQEAALYDIWRALGLAAFRTRTLKIRQVQLDGSVFFEGSAILLEPEHNVAKRFGLKAPPRRPMDEVVSGGYMSGVAEVDFALGLNRWLFQNADAFPGWNSILLVDPEGTPKFAVPYDFDYSTPDSDGGRFGVPDWNEIAKKPWGKQCLSAMATRRKLVMDLVDQKGLGAAVKARFRSFFDQLDAVKR